MLPVVIMCNCVVSHGNQIVIFQVLADIRTSTRQLRQFVLCLENEDLVFYDQARCMSTWRTVIGTPPKCMWSRLLELLVSPICNRLLLENRF